MLCVYFFIKKIIYIYKHKLDQTFSRKFVVADLNSICGLNQTASFYISREESYLDCLVKAIDVALPALNGNRLPKLPFL